MYTFRRLAIGLTVAVCAAGATLVASPASANLKHLLDSLIECTNHYVAYANPIPFTSDEDICTVSERSIFDGGDRSILLNGRQLKIRDVLHQTRRLVRGSRALTDVNREISFCIESYREKGVFYGWPDSCQTNIPHHATIGTRNMLVFVVRKLNTYLS